MALFCLSISHYILYIFLLLLEAILEIQYILQRVAGCNALHIDISMHIADVYGFNPMWSSIFSVTHRFLCLSHVPSPKFSNHIEEKCWLIHKYCSLMATLETYWTKIIALYIVLSRVWGVTKIISLAYPLLEDIWITVFTFSWRLGTRSVWKRLEREGVLR